MISWINLIFFKDSMSKYIIYQLKGEVVYLKWFLLSLNKNINNFVVYTVENNWWVGLVFFH